ncbi:MAG: nitrate ABC transporter substrate-binding protein [Caulobacterales bacterium 32-69-10]|nr:MAG: nitrate ABC transporter substrate-binding protein [Caulobacterales bacterium 32-69-10]
MINRRLLTGALAAGLVAACSRKEQPKDAGAPPLTKLRLATDWRAEAEHGGFYQAVATGEYSRRGLDVQIIQGGPGVNVPQLLASGAADFGVGSNAFIVLNLAAEKAPVTAVMAAFQKDPQVLIAHPDAGVASIADMKGRPILLADASVTAFWVWLKAKYGFTDAQVRKYTFNAAPFLADKRAVQQGYVTSEPYTIEKEAGIKPAIFLLADNGYPGYAAMVLARNSLITEQAPQVQAFVDATAAGWKSYLDGDPAPGNALIRKDNPDMAQDVLDQARAKLKSYGIVDSGDAQQLGIGAMTDARWKAFFDVAAGQGVYPATLDYTAAYTLAFLPKIEAIP